MPDFIPGLELSRLFFAEAVKPILDAEFPDLRYDAALIDSGSEVLGFDTEISRDHHWGPRVSLFVSAEDHPRVAEAINQGMRRRLPYSFRGYSTSFAEIPGEPGIMQFEQRSEGEVNHRVSVLVLRDFVQGYLGFDLQTELTPADWLSFPQQKLRTLTSGAVYHNSLGEVEAMRSRIAYFPPDLWLYLMAAGWTRISQEEPFVGRTGDVGDELGSRVIASRLVRDLMMLAFLIERVYAPYPKWFGTGFARLACASALTPIFHRVFAAETWREREQPLAEAYAILAAMHNALGLTAPLPTEVSPFHSRPYQVIHADAFAAALAAQITDPAVKRLAEQRPFGSLDQFSDSTDLRENPRLRPRIRALYE